jgi:hypothetical protein
MLHGTKVINTLVGGPAFSFLKEGDVIVRIDGKEVTNEEIQICIRGNDIPGSRVVFTVLRRKQELFLCEDSDPRGPRSPDACAEEEEDMDQVEVTITRVATAEIADRRRLFDLLTYSKVCRS